MAQIYKLDSNGKPFEFPLYYLDPKEYGKIISEINSNYPKYEGKRIAVRNTFSEGSLTNGRTL